MSVSILEALQNANHNLGNLRTMPSFEITEKIYSGELSLEETIQLARDDFEAKIRAAIEEGFDLGVKSVMRRLAEEEISEHLAKLSEGEVAATMLTYLLRGGITDDDLRGLRLQWITDERAKMRVVEVWVSWDSDKPSGMAYISRGEPMVVKKSRGVFYDLNGEDTYNSITNELAEFLGVKRGQCKKLRVSEVLP